MSDVDIIWDLPDEPTGNTRHILDGHDVTIDEVEEVLSANITRAVFSRTSSNPIVFGWTTTGKYLAVVFEHVLDDPLTVYPLTAYPVPPPRGRQR